MHRSIPPADGGIEGCVPHPGQRHVLAAALERAVTALPGVGVREVVDRVRQEMPVDDKVVLRILQDLVRRDVVKRRVWGRRHCLFTATDLDAWWMQVAALREEPLHRLYALVHVGAWTVSGLCGEAERRHGWQPSTTKERLQRLRKAGLVGSDRPGVRYARLRARRLHPSAQEAIYNQLQSFRSSPADLCTT